MASEQKMSRMELTAMVVGGMVGAGIFSLPRTFANATGPMGAVIAWLIAGTGMYMLARVFQALAERKPDLDAGVYAYARRLRRLPGLPVGLRLLDRQLHRQRLVLGADQVDARRVLPGLRRRQHGGGDRRRLGRHLAVPLPDPARRAAGGVHQQHRHGRQGHPDPGLHRAADLRLQDRPVQLQPLWRRPDERPVRAGQGDDAGDGVRVHRHRGRQRLFALRQGARGRRLGDDRRLRRRHQR